MTEMTGYFWSGRYVMTEGVQASEELRFPVPTGGVNCIRLTLGAGDVPRFVSLGEILFLEQAPPPESPPLSIEACCTALRVNGVKQFYGPRWIADRVALAMKGEVTALVPSLIFRSVNELPKEDSASPYPVVLRETTGFMMDVRDAERTRQLLSARGLRWEETKLGRYALLAVPRPAESDDAARYPTLYWTEQGCFSADMSRFASRKAHVLYKKAVKLRESGDRTGMMEMLQKALAVCPTHQPARKELIEALETSGRREEAAANAAILQAQTVPQVPASIRFPGGIEFLGLALSATEAKPGGSVEIRYFWKCPPSVEAKRPDVFVHFAQGGAIGFQDDYGLLAEMIPDDIRAQPYNEIFAERRSMTIPDSALPGEYAIGMGLYYSLTGKRLRPDTDLPEKRREVRIPVVLKVGS